jgi:hypothetical protein
MRRRMIVMAFLIAGAGGCVSQMDKDLYSVDKRLRTGCQKFATVVQLHEVNVQKMAEKKHRLEQVAIDGEVEQFIAEHSDPTTGEMFNYLVDKDGNPVMLADGTRKRAPLHKAVLLKIMKERDAKMAELRASQAQWAQEKAAVSEAVAAFVAAVEHVGDTQDSIMDAKQKGQDLAEKAGTAAGAMMVGLLSGAGL